MNQRGGFRKLIAAKHQQATGQAAWWGVALLGQFVLIFAVVALSGPGRIDIVDGQTRYEVARSLVDHGDMVIRDPNVRFVVFPGRDGQLYSKYRLPHSVAGVAAIVLADGTGPVSEPRRHFFFSLIGAAACAVLATTYALWFRHLGHGPGASLLWSTAGILCTPSWFYGTSTFDDILGTAAVVLAIAVAFGTRRRFPWLGAAFAGLALGLAFNFKEPLGVFLPVVLVGCYDTGRRLREQVGRLAVVLAGLALGVAAYLALDWYKFPPGSTADHAELLKHYPPTFGRDPAAAWLGLTISPGVGAFWYCPTLLLSFAGLAVWYRSDKWFFWSVVAASVVFMTFICSLSFFAGAAWGPRYLTPLFAVWWLFTPAGVRRMRPGVTPVLLALGALVQLAGLSVDTYRLPVEQELPSSGYLDDPWLYFRSRYAHLLNRPREIREIVARDKPPATAFTPAPSPTFALPIMNEFTDGPEMVRTYHVFNSFRPWWISQLYLSPEQRPVAIAQTALLLALLACTGLAGLLVAVRRLGRAGSLDAEGAAARAVEPSAEAALS
jgi:hypothetical protein